MEDQMKYSNIFYQGISCPNEDSVFEFLIENLKDTIKGWDFFVAWEKVIGKAGEVDISLNILNSLVGKGDIRESFKKLVATYPEVVEVLPVLLAIRDKSVKVLEPTSENIFNYKDYGFKKKKLLTEHELDELADFAENSGLFSMLQNRKIKNLVDYVIGVEVGLDSNARKNRSGFAMENITELLIKNICAKRAYTYISQATPSKIRTALGFEVHVDKSERSFDYAISTGKKLYLLETNYYGGGGSKLKAVAGEFSSLFKFIKSETPEHGFIWITDGKGWETTLKPLKEAFDKIDYILNLSMIENGILEEILVKGE